MQLDIKLIHVDWEMSEWEKTQTKNESVKAHGVLRAVVEVSQTMRAATVNFLEGPLQLRLVLEARSDSDTAVTEGPTP